MKKLATFAAVVVLVLRADAQDKPKWDVAEALGPTERVEFETSEGTWMNLDVSPDGTQIVFDLLGDVYAIPIEGGSATRITSGPAFDMQPRFSPDGRRIAFASDRNGATNIWTMGRDGADAKQVSRDNRWFINSPAWSPDGQFIFARHEAAEGRRARAPHHRCPAGVRPGVFARRGLDRVRHLVGRREGTHPDHARGRLRRTRRGGEAGTLHRSVVLARRPPDCLPQHRPELDPRVHACGGSGHLRRERRRRGRPRSLPFDGRRRAAAGPRRCRRAAVRSHGRADLFQRHPEREGHAGEREPVRGRRGRAPAVVERHADRAVAGRPMGRVLGAVPHVHRRVPPLRPPGRHRTCRGVVPGVTGVGERRRLAALVRRQPAAALGARPRVLHARSRTHVHVRRRPRRRGGRPQARRARGGGHSDRLRREERRAVGRGGARGRTRHRDEAERERVRAADRGRDGARGGQPHRGRRTVRLGAHSGGRGAHRRQGQDDHPRHHRRARPRRRERRHPRRGELAADGEPRVRRHDVARSLERHGDGVHERGDDPRRPEARAAALLDGHDPLRRGDAVQGGGGVVRRCARAPEAAESGGRIQREELQPAAPRRATDDRQGRARAEDARRPRRGLPPVHEPHAHGRFTACTRSMPGRPTAARS